MVHAMMNKQSNKQTHKKKHCFHVLPVPKNYMMITQNVVPVYAANHTNSRDMQGLPQASKVLCGAPLRKRGTVQTLQG